MRKLEIKDAQIIRLAVQDEILRSEESRYDHRLHGILLVCSGFSCSEVAELFGRSRRTIQYWVRRFEQSGFAGLVEVPRSGRPPVLSEALLQAVGIYSEPVGRKAPQSSSSSELRGEAQGTSMPAHVPPVGIPPAQAAPPHCQSRSACATKL